MTQHIPTIESLIAERLQRADARNEDGPLEFEPTELPVNFSSASERATIALACLVLESLRENGGTKAPKRSLESVLRKTLATLGPKAIMDLEIEAYELMLWIGKAIDPEWKLETAIDPEQIDPTASATDLVRWAIASSQDLEIDYYSRNRGELATRAITPLSFEAEKYIHAYCHLRRDERVFRISRIAEIKPINGWGALKSKAKKSKPVELDDTDQIDLWAKS